MFENHVSCPSIVGLVKNDTFYSWACENYKKNSNTYKIDWLQRTVYLLSFLQLFFISFIICFLFFSFISSSVNLCCLAWTTEEEESKIRIFIYDIAFIKSFFLCFHLFVVFHVQAHTESRIKWKWNVALERLCLVNFCIQMKEHSVHQFKVSRFKSVLANAMHWKYYSREFFQILEFYSRFSERNTILYEILFKIESF